jgi:hypothetical protein
LTQLSKTRAVGDIKELKERVLFANSEMGKLNAYLTSVIQPQPVAQPTTVGEIPSDAPIDPADLEDAPADTFDLNMDGLDQYSKYDLHMPGDASPELVKLLELPVMATFNRTTSVNELGERGFEATNMGGYLVLRKVYILGVNERLCQKEGLNADSMVDLALQKISDKLNDTMGKVCDQGATYRKGGWKFYWYGPKNYRNALTGGVDGHLYVTRFQFPFGLHP